MTYRFIAQLDVFPCETPIQQHGVNTACPHLDFLQRLREITTSWDAFDDVSLVGGGGSHG